MKNNIPVTTEAGAAFFVEVDAQPTADATGASLPSASVSEDTERTLGGSNDSDLRPKGGHMEGVSKKDAAAIPGATAFSSAVRVVKSVSEEITEGLMDTGRPPAEVELSLNLGFDASGNVWIFKGGTRASFRLVLKWKVPGDPGSTMSAAAPVVTSGGQSNSTGSDSRQPNATEPQHLLGDTTQE